MWPLMPLDEMAERAALQALDNNQSEHALRRLMQAYGTEIYRFCYSFMKNKSDAEDMLQLTFMQAYEALEGHSSKSSLRAWLKSHPRVQWKRATR